MESEYLLVDVRRWLDGQFNQVDLSDTDRKRLRQLLQTLNENPSDDPEAVKNLLKQRPEFKDPAFLKRLEELLAKKDFIEIVKNSLPKDPTVPKITNPARIENLLQRVVEEGSKQKPPDAADGQAGGGHSGGSTPIPQRDPERRGADHEWVKWLERNFRDSPAAKRAAEDLVKALEDPGTKGIFNEIPELRDGAWKDVQNWAATNRGDWLKMARRWDLGGGAGSSGSTAGGGASGGGRLWGSGGGGGTSGGLGWDGGTTTLLMMIGAFAALVLAVVLLRRWSARPATAGGAAEPPRSAALDFDAIRSREELVRAFNHVSLQKIGASARSWNHRVIAEELTVQDPRTATPAREVAWLYERARYAPADEDLTPHELAAARQDLRTIAGAGS